MGELIDFTKILNQKRLQDNIENLNKYLAYKDIPEPEIFGWIVVEKYNNNPVKYFNPKYKAFIGYIPGSPDEVYLDYNNQIMSYDLDIKSIVIGLEFGTLSDPIRVIEN